jgi:hypothetical protein
MFNEFREAATGEHKLYLLTSRLGKILVPGEASGG